MNLIESFFFGIIAALGALIAELFVFIIISFFNPSVAISFSGLFIVPYFIVAAACIEEILKYLFISKRIETLENKSSFFVNSLLIGLGFFGVELAFLAANGSKMPEIRFLAEIAIVHVGTAGLIGYAIGFKNPRRFSVFFPALLIATFFHSSYNFMAAKRDSFENYHIFIVLGIIILANLAFCLISKRPYCDT